MHHLSYHFRSRIRSRQLTVLIAVCLLHLCQPANPSAAQQPTPVTPQVRPDANKFLGSDRCDQCHYSPTPRVVRDFAMLDEAKNFIASDKHSLAFLLLKGERGQQMGRLLGMKDVTQEQQCLSCHANWQQGFEKPPHFEKGVSCESCHGPSLQWDRPHSELSWRLESPAAKSALGMIDVRNPVRRAEQCYSCHIGNAPEGKIVTHEMYAAGHPPLPGIEIESFAEQMPAHWRTLAEKGDFQHREEYLKLNSPQDPQGEDWPHTKNTIIGGMVALRESLELITDQAHQDSTEWPELAAFDCQACHHDLRSPSWRQERIPLVAPGRPTLPEWPFALVKIGLRQIAGDDDKQLKSLQDDFIERRKMLYLAMQKQPFGDRAATRAAIAEFLNWLTPNITALEQSRFDESAARRAQAELMTLSDSEYPDFHSARQLVWALGVINQELNLAQNPLDLLTIPQQESLSQRRVREDTNISTVLSWREKVAKPKRQEWVNQWNSQDALFQLPLLLPAGIGNASDAENPEALIVQELPDSLRAISNYDATRFRAMLRKLRDAK